MSDMAVSVGLNIVEEQVLVRMLVEHEKCMIDIFESFSENSCFYYGVFWVMCVLLSANEA